MPTFSARAMQMSQGLILRAIKDADAGIRGNGNYWLDPGKRHCPFCHKRLWRYKFNDQKDGLKCRNTYCQKLNQHVGYVKR